MTDGNNATDGQPTREISTGGDIMQSLAPGAFGVTITANDVKAGMGNIQNVTLIGSDGNSIFAEHHQLGVLPMPNLAQDVPPGEKSAKP